MRAEDARGAPSHTSPIILVYEDDALRFRAKHGGGWWGGGGDRVMLWVLMALGRVADWCEPWACFWGLTFQALRFTLHAFSFRLNMLGAVVHGVWFRV
jgi:hypothetical protein